LEFEKEIHELVTKLEQELEKRTPRSRSLFERAKRVLPGGVTYHIRFLTPYPPYIVKGRGSRVWDVDGNEYIDFWMGHGAHIMGHLPEPVVEALQEVFEIGTHLGYSNPYEVEYAELLTKTVPGLELVRFTNSGTEANMYALRLARAYTKRKYVIKIVGGWHGGYDALHKAVTYPFNQPESLGLPEEYTSLTIAVPFNDVNALEKALKSHEVAAVVMEPVLGAAGCIEPERGYLEEVRRLVDEHGALLIFDEVITGFRLSIGGAQQYYNVRADIVVMGKIVGGGVPGAGAFGGRREVMELLDQLKIPRSKDRSFHGGTFTGNPLTMLAGMKLVQYLSNHPELYEHLDTMTRSLVEGISRACSEHGDLCWVTGARGMIGIHFTRKRPRNAEEAIELRWSNAVYRALNAFMRLRGVLYMTEHNAHLLPSMVHSPEDCKTFVELFREFLDEVSKRVCAKRAASS